MIGGAAVDIISKAASSTSPSSIQHSTVPGYVANTLGGVARNVAEAAHRIHTSSSASNKGDILLISPLGQDSFGSLLKEETATLGMRVDGFSYPTTSSSRTAVCNMVLDSKGDLVGGVADMDIISSMQFKDVRNTYLQAAVTDHRKDNCTTPKQRPFARCHYDGRKPIQFNYDGHMSMVLW